MGLAPALPAVAARNHKAPQHYCIDIQSKARWLIICTFGGGLLEARRLEAGTDLIRALLAAMLELRDTAWSGQCVGCAD